MFKQERGMRQELGGGVAISHRWSGRGLTGKVTSLHGFERDEGISLAEIWGKSLPGQRKGPAPRATGKSMTVVCKEEGKPGLGAGLCKMDLEEKSGKSLEASSPRAGSCGCPKPLGSYSECLERYYSVGRGGALTMQRL